MTDRTNRKIRLYDHVLRILEDCDARKVPIAVASRTEQPAWARELLDLLGITDRFALAEIYPSSKLEAIKWVRSLWKRSNGSGLFEAIKWVRSL